MKVEHVDINQVLAQMRAIKAQAGGEVVSGGQGATGKADFGALLHQSLDAVDARGKEATRMAEAFERGDSGVDLTEVMVALQKASVSFQAMLKVRNHLVEAYKDIKSMPV